MFSLRRSLKVNLGKMKIMRLNGEEILGCEVRVDEIRWIDTLKDYLKKRGLDVR